MTVILSITDWSFNYRRKTPLFVNDGVEQQHDPKSLLPAPTAFGTEYWARARAEVMVVIAYRKIPASAGNRT
jgi:hypothetical protein